MAPFDRSHRTSYQFDIVNVALSCTMFEIFDVKEFATLKSMLGVTHSANLCTICTCRRYFLPLVVRVHGISLLFVPGGAVAVWVASRPEACRLSQLQGCGFESAPLTSIA